MLYRIAHILRDTFPFLWDLVGIINAMLFVLRYRKPLKTIPSILEQYSQNSDFTIFPLTKQNACQLATFFKHQPEEAFTYFKPHGFEEKDLCKLAKDSSFLAYLVTDTNQNVVGYFFMRSFFMGKCFRGYITDVNHRRMGINKLMNQCATAIASSLNIPTFGTIAPTNIASMRSAQSVNDIVILETLSNGDYYVQYLPKKQQS